MSNDRHPEIENGTVGRILRRMTLATLGLDAMDGVSEQSFDVIDKADAFAERLMGGMSNVMPKVHTEYIESRASGLAEQILTGMTGLNGPKSATDLGDWQYWLDAALLMLFDEDEEEEEEAVYASASKTAQTAKVARQPKMQQAMRERVVALKNSGIKPSMLQAMSTEQKRAVISQFKSAKKSVTQTSAQNNVSASRSDAAGYAPVDAMLSNAGNAQQFADSLKSGISGMQTFAGVSAESAQFASTLLNIVKAASSNATIPSDAAKTLATDTFVTGKLTASRSNALTANKIERLFAQDSHHAFVSNIADKAAIVSANLNNSAMSKSAISPEHRAEAMRLANSWTEAVASLNASGKLETSSVRNMLTTIDALESIGAVTREQAKEIRHAGQAYARHILAEEVSRDITAIAGRIEQMTNRASTVANADMVSQRAMTYTGSMSDAEAVQTLKHSVAAIAEKLGSLSETVASKVLADGETAATIRWQRAAVRFTRMQGISDDVDRVLLRDIVESAEALGSTGVVSPETVNRIVSIPAQIQASQRFAQSALLQPGSTQTLIAGNSAINSVISAQNQAAVGFAPAREADKFIQNSAIQMLSQISSRVESSVDTLISNITTSGVQTHQVESFVKDIRRIASQGKAAAGNDAISVIETSAIIESLSDKLDQFAQFSARSVVEQGYDELTSDAPTFVSANESEPQTESSSAAMNAAAVSSVRELQTALQKAQSHAQAQIRSFVESQKVSAQQAETRKHLEALAAANTVEAMVKAQNELSAHLSTEQQTQLKRTIDAVKASESHLENVNRQIQMIEHAVKLSGELKNVLHNGIHASASASQALRNQVNAPVMLSDVRVNGDYLATLGQTLSSYAKIRDAFSKVQSGSISMLSGMDISRLDKMLSIVGPVSVASASDKFAVSDRNVSAAQTVVSGFDKLQSIVNHQNLSISAADVDLIKQYAVSGQLDKALAIASKSIQAQASAQSNAVNNVSDIKHVIGSLASHPEIARQISEHPEIAKQISQILASDSVVAGSSSARETSQRASIEAFLNTMTTANPEVVLGYDEIIPETPSLVSQQAVRSSLYPSSDSQNDLTAMLGSRKAIELHASEMATGRPGSAQTLGQAIERWAASAQGDNTFVSYGISENGEHVKVSLNLKQNQENAGYQLRQSIGSSYMPAAVRHQLTSPVTASISIDKLNSAQTISGAEDFMPVIAGANQSYAASDASTERILASLATSTPDKQVAALQQLSMSGVTLTEAQHEMVRSALQQQMSANAQNAQNIQGIQSAQGVQNAQSAGMQYTSASEIASAIQNLSFAKASQASANNAQTIAERNTVSGILGRLGIQFNATGRMPETSERLQLNIGNVDFDMTSADFVNMVAKPAISATSFMAPSLVNADNVMFSGYASLMQNQAERRSIKSLRKSYVEAMAKSGVRSTHAEIGFNTQSFANILGLTAGSFANDNSFRMLSGSYQTEDSHAFVAPASANIASSAFASDVSSNVSAGSSSQSVSGTEESLAQSIVEGHAPVASSEYGSSVDFSWISSQLLPQFSANNNNNASASDTVSGGSRQILGRIDNMLDYVENMSSRNVGVFDSNETVRVLLEAMPTEGELGNKGLPKWRHKDTKAARAAEARELRDALAKIGANPIQGAQRANDRNYVSPNLFANQNQTTAPLFSGGTESSGGSAPGASATAGTTATDLPSDGNLPQEDLQYIAEEIYNKIIDDLKTELKRRRTE